MINKSPLNDEKLSWKAKGILSYLLSLPDDWQVYETEIQKHASDGIDSLSSGIRELIEFGYIKRERKRSEKGHFKGYEYVIHEVSTESGLSKNGKPKNGLSKNGLSKNRESKTTNNNSTNNDCTNNDSTKKTVVFEVIDYLNLKIGTNFKPTTRETVKFVNGRISEGYTLDDFKYVIDVKYEDWFGNEEMQKNLRPSTLFRPGNFENYINQKRVLTNQEKQLLKLKQMREKRQPEYEMLGDGK